MHIFLNIYAFVLVQIRLATLKLNIYVDIEKEEKICFHKLNLKYVWEFLDGK